MFKKLRNRMLIMHLSMISIMMLISFSALYFITSSNIHKSIDEDLHRISGFKNNDRFLSEVIIIKSPIEGIYPFEGIYPSKGSYAFAIEDKNQEIFDQRLSGFVIVTDLNYQMLSWTTFFQTDDTFLLEALTRVVEASDMRGEFDLDESRWAYLIKERNEGYVISFVDMTSQFNVLQRLIITFVLVSVAMLGVIIGISYFLTERSIQPIKDAFTKQKQFISDASHELKTPLAVIRTNVDVLLTHSNAEDDQWLNYIKEEVDRMAHLTGELLYLAQMEDAQTLEPFKASFSLSEKVEHVLLGVEVVAFEKNLHLAYDVLPGALYFGHAEQIAQVVMILLDNALKYTPEQGHVKLTLSKSAHHYVLTVANTCAGIHEDDLPHIFERFYRGDKSRHRESGSYGLGLSIAKSIVEHHGGKISCENLESGYTIFTVKLRMTSI